MDDRLREIDARLRELDAAYAEILRRLERLESRSAHPTPPSGDAGASAPLPVAAVPTIDTFDLLSLIGRTLIVLGGAFLLRALTDSDKIPNGLGIGLGLAYAVAWYVAADRAGRVRRPVSSLFHGIAAVIISLPLVWEASTRFAYFGAATSAVVIGSLTGLALIVASRRGLQSLAGVATIGAVLATLPLSIAMDQWVPFTTLVIVLGLSAWWLGETSLGWNWLRWPPALMAPLLAIGVAVRVGAEPPRESLTSAVLVHLLLVVAYLAAFGWRTLGRARPIRPFEAVVSVAVVGAGFGGALAETAGAGARTGVLVLGLAGVLASSAAYALAVAIVRRRQGRGANYQFYTSLGLVLLIMGGRTLLSGAELAVVVSLLAVVATGLGYRGTLPTFTLHGALLAATGAVASGLLPAVSVWLGTPSAWPAVSGAAWTALAAAVACLVVPRPVAWHPPAVLATVGRWMLAVVVVIGAGSVALSVLGGELAGPAPEPGVAASLKTGVLSVAAVLLAGLSRRAAFVELGTFVHPILVLCGTKLVLEDFRLSEPSTLFVALILYGAALVLGPRVRRSSTQSAG